MPIATTPFFVRLSFSMVRDDVPASYLVQFLPSFPLEKALTYSRLATGIGRNQARSEVPGICFSVD